MQRFSKKNVAKYYIVTLKSTFNSLQCSLTSLRYILDFRAGKVPYIKALVSVIRTIYVTEVYKTFLKHKNVKRYEIDMRCKNFRIFMT